MSNSINRAAPAPRSEVPIVDLSKDIASQLADAMSVSGFFYIRNHRIAPALLAGLIGQTQAFFAADPAVRQAIGIDRNNRGYLAPGEARMRGATRHDLKEVFFFGRELDANDPDLLAGEPLCAPNQWPASLPSFRPAVLDYLDAVSRSGQIVLSGFARMLGIDKDFFAARYQRPMARGQLIHYPAPPTDAPADQFGVAEHTDFGCITLLYQHTPGLEVFTRSGQWLAVPPIENTLVVNIGDLLERWTNGALPSTRHRVRNLTGNSRYAIAVFYDPSPTAVVDPAEISLTRSDTEANATRYEPVRAADYILGRSQGVFAQFDESIRDS